MENHHFQRTNPQEMAVSFFLVIPDMSMIIIPNSNKNGLFNHMQYTDIIGLSPMSVL